MADTSLTFAAYAGSLRKDSYNKMLLHALVGLAPPHIAFKILDLSEVPLFNMDHERNPPAAVTRMRETIRNADGLIIVSPEHNAIIPAVTKTVIEWASRPPEDSVLDGKPAAVLGGSTGYFGTAKAQVVIRQIATAEGLYFLQDPEVRVARVNTKFNDKGELIDDDLGRTLVEFLEAMAAWTRKITGKT
jgi:chromate reductase